MPKKSRYSADGLAKTCSQCDQLKPLAAYANNKTGRDGLRAYCRTCAQRYRRAWIERCGQRPEVKEAQRVAHAKWRAANIERYRSYQAEYHRKWGREHRAKTAAYLRAWRARTKV